MHIKVFIALEIRTRESLLIQAKADLHFQQLKVKFLLESSVLPKSRGFWLSALQEDFNFQLHCFLAEFNFQLA